MRITTTACLLGAAGPLGWTPRTHTGARLALNPLHAEAHNNLGQILERSRQFEAALIEYRSALQSRPTFRPGALQTWDACSSRWGRPGEAVGELQRLTEPRDAEAPRYLFAPVHGVRAGGPEKAKD